MHRVTLLLVALSAVPATAEAQVCLGQAPWSSGSLKVGGALEIGDGYTDVLGGIGLGKDGGFFFSAGAGIGEGNQILLTGGLGTELSRKLGDKVSICPVASVTLGLEEDDYSYQTFGGGLAGGYPLSSSSENMSVVLTGTFQLAVNHFNVTGVGGDTDILGILDGGIGLVFNQRVSLVPQLRLYVGEESDVALIVRANVAIGRK